MQGTGKTTTALEFAKALNCESPREGQACGECATCHAIEHGNFPDISLISPERQTGHDDQTDAGHAQPCQVCPHPGQMESEHHRGRRHAQRGVRELHFEASRRAPAYLVNILIFRNAASILPTIRSRCQLVRFTQVNSSELASRLVEDFGAEPANAEFLAAYSQGCPGRAIEMMGSERFFARRDELISAAATASSGKPWPRSSSPRSSAHPMKRKAAGRL